MEVLPIDHWCRIATCLDHILPPGHLLILVRRSPSDMMDRPSKNLAPWQLWLTHQIDICTGPALTGFVSETFALLLYQTEAHYLLKQRCGSFIAFFGDTVKAANGLTLRDG